ncbi:helix-turn-helix domain-containing protein [Hymenobacter sp. BT491]|uniref:helix-turn-helix domain-containing protein n=1 Tax=Hymenobacter sp. BT491 TaxID=2766779 RepID=UPI00165372EE|nr:AraC family transcriptional regulator [Hymenobacter sp. BT491]MBC6990391.1 helix-turn-helix transcriptional regulator [Hymenobacter sp. BT491]
MPEQILFLTGRLKQQFSSSDATVNQCFAEGLLLVFMQVKVTLLVVLLFAVVAQAVFAAGLLWVARHNRLPNRFLALLMLAIALWLLDGFFRVSGVYSQDPNWYFAPIFYSFAFGPLLYFYAQRLVKQSFVFRPRHLWHFVPVAIQASLYWWLRTESYAFRTWFWQTVHRPYTYRIEFIGTWLSLLIYLGLSLRLLRQYRRWLADNFSETSQLRLQWLRVLLIALAVVSAQWLGEVVLREFFGRYYTYDYSTELLGIVVFMIGVVGLRQADMQVVDFSPAPEEPEPTKDAAALATAPESRTAFSTTTRAQTVAASPAREPATVDPAVMERLRRALEDEHLYRNPTLTLAELAAHLGLPPRLISSTINNGFNQSFNDLVNSYRVAEVKRRLTTTDDAARLTLLGIAFESGFNSKTTFNRIFKQFTGVAPRDFSRT